ncbi:MAG: hypothetical protein Q7W13_07225 [Bacteroidia bacterium]|nr:hypothetical protein [Bacteroidia bacterium]
MNQLKYFFLFLLAIFLTTSDRANAQNNSDWQPIYLLVTGGNTMDGVEASFQVNTCNGADVIYIKFINHNAKPVKIEWFDAVFSQDLKWNSKEQPGDKKSLVLSANTEVKGECGKNLYPELSVKVKDFVADKKDFKRYSASQFRLVSVQ